MGSCLGIYLGDKIIKYAKLLQDEKTKKITVEAYGTKYVIGDKSEEISDIIAVTGSTGIPLAINLPEVNNIQCEILKQVGKSDIENVIELEVSDYAATQEINEKSLTYKYILTNSIKSYDNYTASIAVANKVDIEKIEQNEKIKVKAIYPVEYILSNIVEKATSNYLLVNIDEKTEIAMITNKELVNISSIDVSMKDILDEIATNEGSYAKACDLCRSINVFSDTNVDINPEIEKIIEPVIQDLLNRIKIKIEESKIKFDKIYLNGLINLFINIDLLFEQYFEIETEKLRPYFLNTEETTLNIAELIESNEATSLAHELLVPKNDDLNFLKEESKFSFKILSKNKGNKSIGSKNKTKSNGLSFLKKINLPHMDPEKISSALLFSNITAGTLLFLYGAFGSIYNAQMSNIINEVSTKTNEMDVDIGKATEDISYINTNKDKYRTFNNYVQEAIRKIEGGEIGKYSTYNVANFMQKIVKYIPQNVQLDSISSDDNKSVKIVAKSSSYAGLGYFISQLKLEGVLENVVTGNVSYGETITVTIGGDLP